MDEIAHIDEFLTGDLVTDAGTYTVNRRVIPNPCMLLENDLQVAQHLNLIHEWPESRDARCIQQVVFEYSELRWIG